MSLTVSFLLSWLARTDPADVARVESRTLVVTKRKQEAITTPKSGIQGTLGNWMSMEQWKAAIQERFPGCMTGTNMETNTSAMKTCEKNTIFTNVVKTSDGGVFWEGMEKEVSPDVSITSWLGEKIMKSLSYICHLVWLLVWSSFWVF
ncbi:phosphoenolpyruvate carboxykinase [GTP]-like isoform X2 [Artemia franciscana]|uniref:phosphoenolpyruvate carboxykinase [GTP]-like isoform X2 n=1 Tax=Artemia franciscana TaxID=6661 RepID=UPI0032DB7603